MTEYTSDPYVEKAFHDLVDDLGVKDEIDLSSIENQFNEKEIHPGVQAVASQLGLPISIRLEFGEKNIQSEGLARTDADGRWTEGIIAQVRIPNFLPRYGTTELRGFPVHIYIGPDYRNALSTLITIVIHELSHVLLHSMRARYCKDEIYTDLVGPILGMCSAVEKGRKIIKTQYSGDSIKTQTTTFGYLSDDQFEWVKMNIARILVEKKKDDEVATEELFEIERLLAIARRLREKILKALSKIDSSPRKDISENDVMRLISFHQPGYLDDLGKILLDSQDHIGRVTSFIKHNNHYTKKRANEIAKYRENSTTNAGYLLSKITKMKDDLDIMKRNIRLWARHI